MLRREREKEKGCVEVRFLICSPVPGARRVFERASYPA